MTLGRVVVLNGVPRSGKSSIVEVIQESLEGPWMNLGVDAFKGHVAPKRFGPGLGLRPRAERPDLEHVVEPYFLALYGSIAAHAQVGLNVVTDIGHHDGYTTPKDLLRRCAALLNGIDAWFVGVRCPLEVIMARRNAGQPGREGVYSVGTPDVPIPPSVHHWQREVHSGRVYDLEVDTSVLSPEACAEAIANRIRRPPEAFRRLLDEQV